MPSFGNRSGSGGVGGVSDRGDAVRRVAVLMVIVVFVACSADVADRSRTTTSPGPKLLFFATPLGVTVVDADSQRATVTVPDGILAPDRTAVFGTSAKGD